MLPIPFLYATLLSPPLLETIVAICDRTVAKPRYAECERRDVSGIENATSRSKNCAPAVFSFESTSS